MHEISRREILTAASAATVLSMMPAHAADGVGLDREKLRLGCCYYPEQWDKARWAKDAADMVARGITRVRIAEFAWTRMEPEPGVYDWKWLDEAVATLAKAGLGIVLGTPTATPPHWLVKKYPEILPVGSDGRTKGFGSRRYYSPSSLRYREECRRIVSELAERYGRNPAVVGWQVDNELGCHDTTLSYGPADLAAFKTWLQQKYGSVARLNEAWGAVFWSQEVSSFEDVGLPIATPYDPPPMKLLDYRLFASEQVRAFQQVQIDVIRPNSPGRFITTNFMGNFTEFDHYAVGESLDFASWDSYPVSLAADMNDARWARTGDPDVTAWNHAIMHAIKPAPFWVMEQEAGPVNWAKANPVPMPGMVRLWSWEAFAHGASTVSFFRWRQVPYGPEQMLSGLNRPDGVISTGGVEAETVAKEIEKIRSLPAMARGDVALLFDYRTVWTSAIQPNGAGQSHLAHAQSWFSALRQVGLDVDIVQPGASLGGYKLIVVPSLSFLTEATIAALRSSTGFLVVGPRTGSKDGTFAIPADLPPGPFQGLLDLKVTQVSSLRPGAGSGVTGESIQGRVTEWREDIETRLPVIAHYDDDGAPAIVGTKRIWYIGCHGDKAFTSTVMRSAAQQAGLRLVNIPETVRLRRRDKLTFAFNYGSDSWTAEVPPGARFLIGSRQVGPYDLAIWEV